MNAGTGATGSAMPDGVAQAYIVKFEDTDREDVVFFGEYAERAAREYFDQSQLNWTCYLFKCIAGPHPAQPQPSSCQCPACKTVAHASDCAVHNAPASANGPCDCGAQEPTAADFREAWDDRCATQETGVSVVMVSGFDELLERAREI